jgi:hypothetical protein
MVHGMYNIKYSTCFKYKDKCIEISICSITIHLSNSKNKRPVTPILSVATQEKIFIAPTPLFIVQF